MLALTLDTSSASTSVALGDVSGGQVVVLADAAEVATNRHGELLAPMIEACMTTAGAAPSDLGRIVVGVGPGPFTGLRVGIVTAVTMGWALGVDVVGVCSLDAVAFAADRPWHSGFAVLSDARRREVYWAAYRDRERIGEPSVDRPAALTDLPRSVVGAGALLHADVLPAGVTIEETAPWPSAIALLRLGFDPAWTTDVRPLYLRRPDAQPPVRPKAVTPA